jgi:hypothetical protein
MRSKLKIKLLKTSSLMSIACWDFIYGRRRGGKELKHVTVHWSMSKLNDSSGQNSNITAAQK